MALHQLRHTQNSFSALCLYIFLCVVSFPTAGASGFLANEIPLEIVTVTPNELLSGSVVEVYAEQTITVVFSRPVVALGADFGEEELPNELTPFTLNPPVEGRIRWVTTYIARFDGVWPHDLEVTLNWNKDLTSYDGVPLTLDSWSTAHLKTPSNWMRLEDVVSARLNRLTGDNWSGKYGLQDDVLPEVPYDGAIELRFGVPVHLDLLERHLKLRQFVPHEGWSAMACPCVAHCDFDSDDAETATCANVTLPNGRLRGSTTYELYLERGTEYNPRHGALKKRLSVEFGGIRLFRVPFLMSGQYSPRFSTKYFDLWFPHGSLKDQDLLDVPLKLKSAKTNKKVPFTKQVRSPSILRLTAEVEPDTQYQIDAFDSSEVRDAFQQPLVGTHMDFHTGPIRTGFSPLTVGSYISRLALFERSVDWGSKYIIFTKGSKPEHSDSAMNAWAVGDAESLARLDVHTARFQYGAEISDVLGKPDSVMAAPFDDPSGEVNTYDIERLLDGIGIIAFQKAKSQRHDNMNFLLLAESSLMMSALTYDTKDRGVRCVVLVTDMDSGRPMNGVTLSFYRSGGVDTVVRSAGPDATTNKWGYAETELDRLSGKNSVILQYGRHRGLLSDVSFYEVTTEEIRDTLILDRKLLQPNETLYVKGYVREISGSQVSVPEDRNFSLEVTANYGGGDVFGDAKIRTVDVPVSQQYGSFAAEVKIPAEAVLQNYAVHLRRDEAHGSYFGEGEPFTVGQPRLPTVELVVAATPWTLPTGFARVVATATSFIGSSVGDQELTVKWAVDVHKEGSDERLTGQEVIVTNDEGIAKMKLSLEPLEGRPTVGGNVDFDIQWVGPTGELIEESAQTKIALADLLIATRRTVETDIPMQSFGVWVELTDLDGRPLSADTPFQEAEIALKSLPEGVSYDDMSSEPLEQPSVLTCHYNIGDAPCDFALPSMGVYILESCVSGGSFTVCRRDAIGNSETYWKEHPWTDFLPIGVQLDRLNGAMTRRRVKFTFENPYESAMAMIHVGNAEHMTNEIVPLNNQQRSKVFWVLPDTCLYTCSVSVLVAIPRQNDLDIAEPPIPVAKLHDPAMPHVFHWTSTIRLDPPEEKNIDIGFRFPSAAVEEGDVVVAPGDKIRLKLHLSTRDRAEVTLMVVDKAVLEAISNPLKNASDAFKIDLGVRFKHASCSDYVISPAALETLIDNFEREKRLNPWFHIDSNLDRHNAGSDLELTDEAYIDKQARYLTVSSRGDPPGGGRAVFAEAKSMEISTPAEASVDVRVESEFVPNVLFVTKRAKKGKLTVEFDAPAKLGAFVVRAYAVSGLDAFGSAETEFIVRRHISLTPAVPRFVRVGDEFLAGAIVTVTGSSKAKITFTVDIEGPLRAEGPKRMKVVVGSDNQADARFGFKATAMGEAKLTFTAYDKWGNRDAVQVDLPIEGKQESVVVATSFTLTAAVGRMDMSSEGLDLPAAVPGSGTIELVAGVGQEPTVMSLVSQFLSKNADFECPYTAGFILGATLIPGIMNPYSPWNAPNQAELVETVLDMFVMSAELISIGKGKMTRVGKGLLNALPCEDDRRSTTGGHLWENARAVWLMNEVEPELEAHPSSLVAAMLPQIRRAKQEWIGATEKYCVEVAERSRTLYNFPVMLSTVALCRMALGANWNPNHESDVIKHDLSMKKLHRRFNKLGLESQAMYVLTLLRTNPDHKDIREAVKQWTGLYRVTGRTAYISAYEGAATPASTVANALILAAMTRAGTEGQLLPKLAAYVASPARGQGYGRDYLVPYDTTVIMWALVVYDASRGSTRPDVDFEAVSGAVRLMQATFDEDSPSSVKSTTNWDRLGPQPLPITFAAVGSGEVSIAVALNFVPAEILPYPSYRGIFVERTVQFEESGEGGAVSVVSEGSVVFVRVQFMTPDSLQATIVRVLMPAGLEPIDPNVAGDGQFCPVPFFSFYSSRSCPQQKTRPTVVTFEYPGVPAGTHTVTFKAVAVTPGLFTLPPTRVFVRDQPEVMGLSSAGSFQVCDGKCEPVHETSTFQPKSCPEDCNDNGSCNLSSGTCICFEGFRGETCTPIAT